MSSVALKDYKNATFNGFTKRLRPKKGRLMRFTLSSLVIISEALVSEPICWPSLLYQLEPA